MRFLIHAARRAPTAWKAAVVQHGTTQLKKRAVMALSNTIVFRHVVRNFALVNAFSLKEIQEFFTRELPTAVGMKARTRVLYCIASRLQIFSNWLATPSCVE